MIKLAPIAVLAVILGHVPLDAAQAFPPPGPWDAVPMDAPARMPASVGAAIAAAEARVNARNRSPSDRQSGIGAGVNSVQENCSLQVGSVTMPSRGSMSGQTVVANADVRGTIIQVCR